MRSRISDWIQSGKSIGDILLRKVTIRRIYFSLRWEVYVKEKEELTKREFSVSVPHPKERAIV